MPGITPATVQRVLFPFAGDEEASELYVRTDAASSWDRTSVRLTRNGAASFETYFGAFPAGYWRAHAGAARATIVGEVSGGAHVTVCAATRAVGRQILSRHKIIDAAFSVPVDLGDAQWLWIEVDASEEGAHVSNLEWRLEDAPAASVAVCLTTHDRPDDCVRVLERLADDESGALVISHVIVVDQGGSPVSAAPGWREVAERLGGRLRLIRQANLGGSGGFSRGMIEALTGDATHVLLLDDDVLLEPESIHRLVAFSVRSIRPVIVGAQMLSLLERSRLHTYGERLRRSDFWWVPVSPELAPVDVAASHISHTPAMRQVYEVDFNGWWMCLVPRAVLEQQGASLPFFIKWDDAEFALRAREHGVETVTLPGAAIWHMPWTGKDDGLDWQAYYQLRNRLVTALAHAPAGRGGGILRSTLAQDINHILCLQYGSAAARAQAMRDVLTGPDHLAATLRTRIADIRALMERAGQSVVPDAALPALSSRRAPAPPRGPAAFLARALHVASHQLRASRSDAAVQPIGLERADGKWWSLGLLDAAVVRSATGAGAFVARRDRRRSLSDARSALALRFGLWWHWPRLRREYSAAVTRLASPAAWEQTFANAAADPAF